MAVLRENDAAQFDEGQDERGAALVKDLASVA